METLWHLLYLPSVKYILLVWKRRVLKKYSLKKNAFYKVKWNVQLSPNQRNFREVYQNICVFIRV